MQPNKIMILTEDEIRSCVPIAMEALEEVAKGYSLLAQDRATIPPVLRIDIPEHNGEVDVKTAYLHGLDSFAIKIAAGFLDNHLLGLPTGSGMMVVVSAETGRPMAILLDNGYLTNVRTGIAGAIAAQHLAPGSCEVAGVIGSGAQARYQMRALQLVREFSTLLVYGIVEQEVDRYVEEMAQELEVDVVKAPDAESVVRQSSIVVTTTPSRSPYLRAEWLHPGLHITCMGSDSEEKQELFPEVFAKADRIVCDKKSQVFRLGELHHALDAGVIQESDAVELGQITAGYLPGREAEEEISICDLTGVGVQDTQIARLAVRRAQERGLGQNV